MLEKSYGNILEVKVEALVNPVNCVGVMGKGLALAFKQAYPDNFLEYQAACRLGEVKPGRMFIAKRREVENEATNPKYIINFPTKRHWKENSRIEDIQSGLVSLTKEVKKLRISSIAVPALGCGLGGLRWEEVEELIVDAFKNLPEVIVVVFPPKS